MMLVEIESAVRAMRAHLLECAVRADWGEERSQELLLMASECFRRLAATSQPVSGNEGCEGAPRCQILRRVIRYVNANLDSKLAWDELAAAVGLKAFAFARHFKHCAGMTPHQYVTRCRLRRAMRLLSRSDLSLAEIALEVGCSCQSHLTALFRRHLGTTPGTYRLSNASVVSWRSALRRRMAESSHETSDGLLGS